MRRGLIAGALIVILGGLALWRWSATPHEAVVLAKTRRAEPVSPAASAGQGGAWALLAEATRQADAAEPQGRRFCGAPFMDEGDEPTEAMYKRLHQHLDAITEREAKRLVDAPDELGRMASAIMLRDDARIARIADASRDPVVYGIALQECQRQRLGSTLRARDAARRTGGTDTSPEGPPGPCSGITAAGWIERDPDNAAAWWMLAAESSSRDAAFEAMSRAKGAPRTVNLRGHLLKRVAAEQSHDMSAMLALVNATIGREAMMPAFDVMALQAACPRGGDADPVRRAACEEIAIDATRRQIYVGERNVMRAFAEIAGVPPERLPERKSELRALYTAMERWQDAGSSSNPNDMNCLRVGRMVAFAIESVGEGDISAYRRLSKAAAAASAASASQMREPG